MKVMKKEIYILLSLVLLLIGCNKTKSSTNTLASNIGDATIDSVIVLGRDPYEFTSIPIGRYAFVEYCISKNVNNDLRIIKNNAFHIPCHCVRNRNALFLFINHCSLKN